MSKCTLKVLTIVSISFSKFPARDATWEKSFRKCPPVSEIPQSGFAILAIVRDIDGRKNLWLTATFAVDGRMMEAVVRAEAVAKREIVLVHKVAHEQR